MKIDNVGEQLKNKELNKFPLSEIQQAYYIGKTFRIELGGRTTKIAYLLEFDLDFNKFEEALNKVIKDEDMLRVVVINNFEQKVLEELPYYKINRKSIDVDQNKVKKTLDHELNLVFEKKFMPYKWPLFEVDYLLINKKPYLIVAFDMLIVDALSLGIISNKIMNYYNDCKKRTVYGMTYREHIQFKQNEKKSQRYQGAKEYWLSKLEDIKFAPKLPLKVNRQDNTLTQYRVDREKVIITSELWNKVKIILEENKISNTAAMFTFFSYAIASWSEDNKFTINMTINNRSKKFKETIGDFTSSLLIDFDVTEKNNVFSKDVAEVEKRIRRSYRHSQFSAIEIMKEISRSNNLSGYAVMPVVFTSLLFKNNFKDRVESIGKILKGRSETPQVFIDCIVMESFEGLVITIDYVKDYIDGYIIDSILTEMYQMIVSLAKEKNSIDALEKEDYFPITKHWKKYIKENPKVKMDTIYDNSFDSVKTECHEVPRTETEIILYNIWEEVLGIKNLSINDNFFELGGDSLKAVKIYEKIKRLGYDIDVGYLLENNTIKKLAYIVEKKKYSQNSDIEVDEI